MAGRPSKLDEDVKDKLIAALREGKSYDVAGAEAGVDERTVCRWVARGREEPDSTYAELAAVASAGACHATKFTPEIRDKVLSALRSGNFRNIAAEWAGIDERTFTRWMANGREDPESDYGDFARDVVESERSCEVGCLAMITKAAREGDPKHAEWLLTHRFPDRWAPVTKHEVTSNRFLPPEPAPGVLDLNKYTEAEVLVLIEANQLMEREAEPEEDAELVSTRKEDSDVH